MLNDAFYNEFFIDDFENSSYFLLELEITLEYFVFIFSLSRYFLNFDLSQRFALSLKKIKANNVCLSIDT